MKKLFILIFGFALMASLAACGTDKSYMEAQEMVAQPSEDIDNMGILSTESFDKGLAENVIPAEEEERQTVSEETASEISTDLTGNWKQSNSESEDSYQIAVVDENTITVYHYSEDNKSCSLYWSGTFLAPKKTSFVLLSTNYHDVTDSNAQASHAETKKFEYNGGQIIYELSVRGKTWKVHLEKTDEFALETEKPDEAVLSDILAGTGTEKISGFDKKTNQTITFKEVNFSFPSYFDVKNDNSTEDEIYYSARQKSAGTVLFFGAVDAEGITQKQFDEKIPLLDSEMMKFFSQQFGVNATKTESERISIAGLPGWQMTCSGTDRDNTFIWDCAYAYNSNLQKIIIVMVSHTDNGESDYDYSGDYEKMIKSATLARPERDKKTSPGVDPDFKEAMDSYEAFFDSYVEFMKKYSNSDNPLEMLSDYADYMNTYMDTMEKMYSIDTDKLSTEDYKYYIDVMSRINKKLLEVSAMP